MKIKHLFRRTIAMMMILIMMTSSVAFAANTNPAVASPEVILITTAAQLSEIASQASQGKTYILMNDIDLAGAANWASIGTEAQAFNGTFDGNGHVIRNLNIGTTNDLTGLFGVIAETGLVKNLGLTGTAITGGSRVGGIAGLNKGTISNCYNTGTVKGTSYIGGLVGYNKGFVKSCYNTGAITADGENTPSGPMAYLGGIAGANANKISQSYNQGSISSRGSRVGGISGVNSDDSAVTAVIENCYNEGSITGSVVVGGIAGINDKKLITFYGGVLITKCYNTGLISAAEYGAGIVGNDASNPGSISFCTSLAENINGSGMIRRVANSATASQDSSSSLHHNYAYNLMTKNGLPNDQWNHGVITEGEIYSMDGRGIPGTMGNNIYWLNTMGLSPNIWLVQGHPQLKNVTLSATVPSFPSAYVGSTTIEQPIQLTNSGNTDATITSVTLESGSHFTISSAAIVASPTGVVEPRKYSVGLKSNLTAGTFNDVVVVNYTDASGQGQTAKALVSATLTYPAASLTVNAPSFEKVDSGTSPEVKAIQITNSGDIDAEITALSLETGTSFTLNRTEGISLAAGATDVQTYTLSPKANLAAGTYTDRLIVQYKDANSALRTATASVSIEITAPDLTNLGKVNDGIDFAKLTANGDRVYYGRIKHPTALQMGTKGAGIHYEEESAPILWRVMGQEPGSPDGGYTFLSEYAVFSRPLGVSNDWDHVVMKQFLNDTSFAPNTYAFTHDFRINEIDHIKVTTDLSTRAYPSGEILQYEDCKIWLADSNTHYEGPNGPGDVTWYANIERTPTTQLGNTNYDTVATLKNGVAVDWWLRSPVSHDATAGWIVGSNGPAQYGGLSTLSYGIRPLFKFDETAVLYASEILANPVDQPWATPAVLNHYNPGTGSSKNYKLTLVNSALELGTVNSVSGVVHSGDTLVANPGTDLALTTTGSTANTKLTYKIVASKAGSRQLVGYGYGGNSQLRIDTKDFSGVNLPKGDYTVYVWAQSDQALNSNEGSSPIYFNMSLKETYPLQVENGTGSNNYEAGQMVNIQANTPPQGKVFDYWSSNDGVTFANSSAESTTFIMPSKAVTVTATYKTPAAAVLRITSTNTKTILPYRGGTHQVTATGATPITYSISGQPTGVSINASTGLITIDNTVGPVLNNSTFTITARSGPMAPATQMFTLRVADTPVIRVAGIQPMTVGDPINIPMFATGENPIVWSIASGSLPAGLSLSSNGAITGSPTTAGISTVAIKASNAAGEMISSFSITVNAKSVTPNPNPSGGTENNGQTASPSPSPVPAPVVTVLLPAGIVPLGAPGTGFETTVTAVEAKMDGSGKAIAATTEAQVNESIKKAIDAAEKKGAQTKAQLEIQVSGPADAKTVGASIPKSAFAAISDSKVTQLTVNTSLAAISFDDQSMSTITKGSTADVKVSIEKVDPATLSKDAQAKIGDKPIFNFSVTTGDKNISQFGGQVMVSIPYTPKPGEDQNAIVIYYINAEGKLEKVGKCAYDSATGTIRFTTSHFSQYAVGYEKVSFTDVSANDWYSTAVSFIAARGIALGNGDGKFMPEGNLTRSQLLVMVMNAYGIKPDENPVSNFSDAGNTYYTGYLAAAKRLGLSAGIGNNQFGPEKVISRQEMSKLLLNLLSYLNQVPTVGENQSLESYKDQSQIANWAKEPMSLLVTLGALQDQSGQLSPTKNTTRAEMALALYKLLSQ